MKILVINAGSSSLKYQLINMQDESVILKGVCERITAKGGILTQKTFDDRKVVIEQDMPTHKEAMELVLKAMLDKENGALNSVDVLNAEFLEDTADSCVCILAVVNGVLCALLNCEVKVEIHL